MELVPIYEGPTMLCGLLREALQERGIRAVQRAVGPFLGIIGDVAQTPYSLVLISRDDQENRPAQVDECLALVLPDQVELDDAERADPETHD